NADIVTITLDNPVQIGDAGDTLQFYGTITNNADATVYLNSDDLTLNGLSFAITDFFFANVPASLAANASSGNIDLFQVTVSNPLADPPATYLGSLTLLGGGYNQAQDNLGTVSFSVTTPEPSAIYLLLGMLSLTMVLVSLISRKARARGGEPCG
ncbi:MAG: hypothetical protein ABR987_25080, partial [Terracidiphilus sp.]